MAENFPDLVKKKVTHVQEALSPNQDDPKATLSKTHHI